MANLDTATRGSICEHDILLSISEEAINRQFKLLYDKPISLDDYQPPPPGLKLESGAQTLPSKYYINHELQIFKQVTDEDTDEITFDPDAGLFAHVKCPYQSQRRRRTELCSGYVCVKKLEGAEVPDSLYHYCVGKGKNATIKTRIVNGWTMSWKVKIGGRTFGDVQTDIVNPAESSSHPIVVHPDTIKSLKKVNPSEVTVAAIFCIFEDAQLASSFEVKDETGKEVKGGINDLMHDVSHYFTSVQDASGLGNPTADNPFVLGYSLSQTVPGLRTLNPDAIADSTPKYLIPKGYQMTTTAGITYENGKPQNS